MEQEKIIISAESFMMLNDIQNYIEEHCKVLSVIGVYLHPHGAYLEYFCRDYEEKDDEWYVNLTDFLLDLGVDEYGFEWFSLEDNTGEFSIYFPWF